jgi:hypothetical protein
MSDMALRGPVLDPPKCHRGGAAHAGGSVMPKPIEEHISIRAHELWERAGSPEGREDEFWHRAEKELQETDELRDPEPPPAKLPG